MADEYPRLLEDRDVVVIRDGHLEQTRLRGWLDGHDGPVPAYRIELVTRLGSYTCPYTATGPDMFEALVRLRRQLEPDGLMVAVQGSRRDTYPSGMARDMGGGLQVLLMRPGLRGPPSARPFLVLPTPARSASCARRRPPPRPTRPQDRQQRTPHWQSQASTSISATPPSEVPAIFGSHASCPKYPPTGCGASSRCAVAPDGLLSAHFDRLWKPVGPVLRECLWVIKRKVDSSTLPLTTSPEGRSHPMPLR